MNFWPSEPVNHVSREDKVFSQALGIPWLVLVIHRGGIDSSDNDGFWETNHRQHWKGCHSVFVEPAFQSTTPPIWTESCLVQIDTFHTRSETTNRRVETIFQTNHKGWTAGGSLFLQNESSEGAIARFLLIQESWKTRSAKLQDPWEGMKIQTPTEALANNNAAKDFLFLVGRTSRQTTLWG